MRPGALEVDDRWMEVGFWEPSKDEERLFYAVHEDDAGTPDAFAMYGTKHEWPRGLPSAEMSVKRHVAATPVAGASLWRFLFDVDLVSRVKTWSRPVDDPLLLQLTEPRSLRPELTDALFLRPLRVELALAARGYAADGRVVLEVSDSFLPVNDGTYELVVDRGVPVCRRVEGPADVACSVHAIGSTYLGVHLGCARGGRSARVRTPPGARDDGRDVPHRRRAADHYLLDAIRPCDERRADDRESDGQPARISDAAFAEQPTPATAHDRKSRSLIDTLQTIATANPRAAAHPVGRRDASTADAVVTKKNHAPGLTTTAKAPTAVGPNGRSARRRIGRRDRRPRIAAQDRDRDQKAADHAHRPERPGDGSARTANASAEQDRERRRIGPERDEQTAASPAERSAKHGELHRTGRRTEGEAERERARKSIIRSHPPPAKRSSSSASGRRRAGDIPPSHSLIGATSCPVANATARSTSGVWPIAGRTHRRGSGRNARHRRQTFRRAAGRVLPGETGVAAHRGQLLAGAPRICAASRGALGQGDEDGVVGPLGSADVLGQRSTPLGQPSRIARAWHGVGAQAFDRLVLAGSVGVGSRIMPHPCVPEPCLSREPRRPHTGRRVHERHDRHDVRARLAECAAHERCQRDDRAGGVDL
jgi:hypothetical protein